VSAVANYSRPVGIGEVMRSYAPAPSWRRVILRTAKDERVDRACSDWQDYAITDGSVIRRKVTEDDLPLSLSLASSD
jgi:hypothetical protein